MINKESVEKFVSACEKALELKDATLGEEYNYNGLALCLIDAVFSIGVNYEKIVKPAVERYCDELGITPYKVQKCEDEHNINDFIAIYDEKGKEELSTISI